MQIPDFIRIRLGETYRFSYEPPDRCQIHVLGVGHPLATLIGDRLTFHPFTDKSIKSKLQNLLNEAKGAAK